MPVRRLKEFLDENAVKYVSIAHSIAYTAPEIAETAHVPGHEMAKVVVVDLDDRLAMVVVRGTDKVDLELLRGTTGAGRAALAAEQSFEARFPGVEPGAMPPFGNLYEMPVYVDQALADEPRIAFNAGNHHELVRLAYADFARLVEPVVGRYAY